MFHTRDSGNHHFKMPPPDLSDFPYRTVKSKIRNLVSAGQVSVSVSHTIPIIIITLLFNDNYLTYMYLTMMLKFVFDLT